MLFVTESTRLVGGKEMFPLLNFCVELLAAAIQNVPDQETKVDVWRINQVFRDVVRGSCSNDLQLYNVKIDFLIDSKEKEDWSSG